MPEGRHTLSLGNMTQFKIIILGADGLLNIGIENRGCYGFQNWCHPNYVSEKLNIPMGDANNFTDFLNDQLGHADKVERFGKYDPALYEWELAHEGAYE